jgi:hypothetical protein
MAKNPHLLIMLFFFLILSQNAFAQEKINRKNEIKLNLLPVSSLFNGHNQKWLGIEYERHIANRTSISTIINAGLFEDYTFIKYHDYFDEHEGFSYTKTNATTWGYHLIPSLKYYFIILNKTQESGFYLSGNLDFSQYFRKTRYFQSLSGNTSSSENSTTRLAIGASLGGQYIFFSRLIFGANISLFARLFSVNKDKSQDEIFPLNANWKFSGNTGWATANIMIGYAFRGGKRK